MRGVKNREEGAEATGRAGKPEPFKIKAKDRIDKRKLTQLLASMLLGNLLIYPLLSGFGSMREAANTINTIGFIPVSLSTCQHLSVSLVILSSPLCRLHALPRRRPTASASSHRAGRRGRQRFLCCSCQVCREFCANANRFSEVLPCSHVRSWRPRRDGRGAGSPGGSQEHTAQRAATVQAGIVWIRYGRRE